MRGQMAAGPDAGRRVSRCESILASAAAPGPPNSGPRFWPDLSTKQPTASLGDPAPRSRGILPGAPNFPEMRRSAILLPTKDHPARLIFR